MHVSTSKVKFKLFTHVIRPVFNIPVAVKRNSLAEAGENGLRSTLEYTTDSNMIISYETFCIQTIISFRPGILITETLSFYNQTKTLIEPIRMFRTRYFSSLIRANTLTRASKVLHIGLSE